MRSTFSTSRHVWLLSNNIWKRHRKLDWLWESWLIITQSYSNLQPISMPRKHNFCMQRAKVGYLKQVDQNSSFSHALVKRNNRQNEVTTVERSDGILTESFAKVVKVFNVHYHQHLGTSAARTDFPHSCLHFGRRIRAGQHEQLEWLPTMEEIKTVLYDIGDQRVPRSDGCGSKNFKRAWGTIGGDLIVVVMEFFQSGKLL